MFLPHFLKIWLAAAVTVLPLLITGCGELKDSESVSSEDSAPNELIQISVTSLARAERPSNLSVKSRAGTSDIGITTSGKATAADREATKLSPEVSGWDTERLSALAYKKLGQLGGSSEQADFGGLLSNDFKSSALVATNFKESSLPGGIRIHEGSVFPSTEKTLEQELASLRSRVGGGSVIRFKPVGVGQQSEDGGRFTTKVLVEVVGGHSNGAAAQVDAVWQCSWLGTSSPKLTRISVKSYREVHSPGALFKDATLSAFKNAPSFARQMMHGIGYWSQRLTRVDDMEIMGHHGIAVGDVNGDGLDDVYACDGGGLPNRLYIQAPDGTVTDQSAAAQVDFLEASRSALIVDLDNDGDQDLVVATVALILFAENDGTGKFTLRGGHSGSPGPYSMAAADFDSDGDLDVYVTGYGKRRDSVSGAQGFEASSPIPYNDAKNGGRNLLLANHGAFRFSDVTGSVGLDDNNTRWSFAAAWEDYDQDGDVDLYVVNDFGRNNFYRNDGGKFQDIAAELGVEDMAAGMSASWGDHNGDGKLDLYVGNMFSAAGKRVTYQRKFDDSRSIDDVAAMQRMARGNSLFQQGSEGAFQDVSEVAGVTMGRWAWSSGFVDLNNDGREDLVVANGYLSNPGTDDL